MNKSIKKLSLLSLIAIFSLNCMKDDNCGNFYDSAGEEENIAQELLENLKIQARENFNNLIKSQLDKAQNIQDKEEILNKLLEEAEAIHQNLQKIHLAAKYGVIELLEKYIKEDPKAVNATTNSGFTPLFFAMEDQSCASLKFLLENGANINARDNQDRCLMYFAFSNDNPQAISFLNKSNLKTSSGFFINFLDQIKNDNDLKNKFNYIDSIDWQINLAIKYNCIELLEKNKANIIDKVKSYIEIKTKGLTELGKHPIIIIAAEINRKDIIDLFLSWGADINSQGFQLGNSALHVAVRNRNLDLVKFLLSKNINKNLKNKNGHTALDFAQEIDKHDSIMTNREAEEKENLEKIIELLSN